MIGSLCSPLTRLFFSFCIRFLLYSSSPLSLLIKFTYFIILNVYPYFSIFIWCNTQSWAQLHNIRPDYPGTFHRRARPSSRLVELSCEGNSKLVKAAFHIHVQSLALEIDLDSKVYDQVVHWSNRSLPLFDECACASLAIVWSNWVLLCDQGCWPRRNLHAVIKLG